MPTIELASLWVQGFLAIAAFLALGQISVTKESFRLNSKRESIKFALGLIKEFKDLIPVTHEINDSLEGTDYKEYKGEFNLKYFSRIEVKENPELQRHLTITMKSLPLDDDSFSKKINSIANDLEYIATPFIERIADEEVAFNVIGLGYCSLVEKYYFLFVLSRKENDEECTYYKNAIKLYLLWRERIDRTRLTAIQKKAQASIEKIPDKKITPIGT